MSVNTSSLDHPVDSSLLEDGGPHHADPRYQEALQQLQSGAWREAEQSLQSLLAAYPDQASTLNPLLSEAQLKANLSSRKVRGRSIFSLYLNQNRLGRIMAVLLLCIVVGLSWWGYTARIAPLRAEQLQRSQISAQLADGKTAMMAANFVQAESLFQQVLALQPDSAEARQGLAEARSQQELAAHYAAAVATQASGDLEQALTQLLAIQAQSPGYRDVESRVTEILRIEEVKETYLRADLAYTEERWAEAIRLYSSVRERNSSYEAETVTPRLHESLSIVASETSATAGLGSAQIQNTIDLYRQALSLQPADNVARSRTETLSAFLQARSALEQKRLDRAVQILAAIYVADPGLLGGDVRQSLYESRLAYGWQLHQADDLQGALTQYQAAAALPMNVDEAVRRAQEIALALTPTPQPPTPTPTADPVQALLSRFEPTPVPSPLEQFQGWIAFLSDRTGSRGGLWVMRPDGSDPQPASDPNRVYAHLKHQATWTQDNMRRIWVEDDGSNVSVAIYMWRYDIPQHWQGVRVELLNNSAINYEAVLSPNGQHIAFTSQRNDAPNYANWGDEIFVLHFSEYNESGYVTPRRLTHNDWEWDKHPTFSPDSRTIAFWSNRGGGRSQIWAMNLDGSNQRNLSNNEWNDFDPVFIVPVREVPKLDQDRRN